MNKVLLIAALAVTVVIAKPAYKGAKKLNKGAVNSSFKGANSVVKPNKVLKKNDSILDLDKSTKKAYKKAYKKDYKKSTKKLFK